MHIQHSLFGHLDDVAYVQIKGKVKRVPVWLAFLWHKPEGISSVILEWQGGILAKTRSVGYEYEALRNIEDEAKAMWKFYNDPNARRYYRHLSSLEKQALNLERVVSFEKKSLQGQAKYEEIAKRMSRSKRTGAQEFPWYQVRAILEEARDVLTALYRVDEGRAMERLARSIQDADESEIEQFQEYSTVLA